MGAGLVYGGSRLRAGDEVDDGARLRRHASRSASRAERDGIRIRRIKLYGDPASSSVEGIVAAVSRGLTPRTRCLAVEFTRARESSFRSQRSRRSAAGEPKAGADERVLPRSTACTASASRPSRPSRSAPTSSSPAAVALRPTRHGHRVGGSARVGPAGADDPVLRPAYLAWLEGRAPKGIPPGPLASPGGFHCFEQVALTEAFAFHDGIGRTEVAEQTRALASRLKDGLAEIDRVDVVTPTTRRFRPGSSARTSPGAIRASSWTASARSTASSRA